MGKKSEPNLDAYLEGVLENMNEDEQAQLMSMLMSVSESPDLLQLMANHNYYYPHPDYGRLTKPRGQLIQRLNNELHERIYNQDIEQAPDEHMLDEFLEGCKALPREELARELTNDVYHLLDSYHRINDQEDDDIDDAEVLELTFVMVAMEQFSLEECVPAVLELVRQDAIFHSCYTGLLISPLTTLLLHLYPKSLAPLLDVACDNRLVNTMRVLTADVVTRIAAAHPERRMEVATWASLLLQHISKIKKEKGITDFTMLDSACTVMATIHATELLPQLEVLFKTIPGFHSLTLGDEKQIIKAIKDKNFTYSDTELEFDNMREFALMQLSNLNFDDDSDDDGAEAEEEIDFFAQVKYLPADKVQELILDVKLNHIEPGIWRRIVVPSNISLDSLARLILIAMGWNGSHMYQFVKGRVCYRIPFEYHSSFDLDIEDMRLYSASHLLTRRRSWTTLEYDIGDGWEHRVTVTGTREYAPGEPHVVKLIHGARACPPDDVGGVWGYKDLCHAVKNPRSEQAHEFKQWLGYTFNPEEFNLKDAAAEVDKLN